MSEQNKELARRFYAEMNAGNADIIFEATTENFVEHDEFPGIPPTRDGVREFFLMMRKAFPDMKMSIEDMISEGDRVFIRASMTGTHKGEFMGIPATGKQIKVPMGDFVRIENGKVAEHWGVTDSGMLMQQLGATGA